MRAKEILAKATIFLLSLNFLTANEHKWSPDFLIIGAQKSGTSTLYELVQTHPNIVKKKGETRFFDRNFEKGITWYQHQFAERPSPHHLIGDKSPAYLFNPFVPARVKELYPHVKIIVILRNPVDRAYSHYWHEVRLHYEHLPFQRAIEEEPKRLEGTIDQLANGNGNCKEFYHFSYLSRGIYVEQINRWLKYFPEEQMLIITLDDLRNDPEKILKKILTFLQLPFMNMPILSENKKQKRYPPLDPKLRQHLIEFYQPYNHALEDLLDRKFNWDK